MVGASLSEGAQGAQTGGDRFPQRTPRARGGVQRGGVQHGVLLEGDGGEQLARRGTYLSELTSSLDSRTLCSAGPAWHCSTLSSISSCEETRDEGQNSRRPRRGAGGDAASWQLPPGGAAAAGPPGHWLCGQRSLPVRPTGRAAAAALGLPSPTGSAGPCWSWCSTRSLLRALPRDGEDATLLSRLGARTEGV